MRTTFMAIATTSALALVLTACGGDGDGGTANPDSAKSGGLNGTGNGESCTIKGEIPVGAALSLTGAAASYGDSQKKGLELAASKLGENTTIKYGLKIEDDATDPKQGITVFEELAKGRNVIIGPTLSNTAFQAQPIAQEKGVPVLAISNTASGITAQGNYIFRDALTEAQVIPQAVAKAKEKFGLKKVVVMYSNDDAFTESGYKVFDQALKAEGIGIATTLTFSKADTNFRALLTEAKGAKPDAIVVSGLIEAAIPLVTQARELGLDMPIIGGNGFNNPKLMADAGKAAEDVVVGAAWNSASKGELNTAFQSDYEAKYKTKPDQFAAQAYAGMFIIDAAVRSGCSGERDAIRKGLAGISDLDTVLGTVSINKDRDAEYKAVVQVVKDGTFTVLE